MNPAFKEIYTDNEISTYNLALEGEGTAGSHIDFCLDFQHGERNSAYSLFGRGTSVLPVTSAASHPLQKAINLKDVKMVAKMYYPETARMDEGGLLKVAHSIAGSELDPDGYVQGHLPLLIASHSWKDRYWKRMNALFDVKKLKRVSRCFRVLVFVKIYPIWELQGDEFVRALFDSLCCKSHGLPISPNYGVLTNLRPLWTRQEWNSSSRYKRRKLNVLSGHQRKGGRRPERFRPGNYRWIPPRSVVRTNGHCPLYGARIAYQHLGRCFPASHIWSVAIRHLSYIRPLTIDLVLRV